MDALADIEEIAEQTSFRTNTGTRKRQIKTPGNKWGHVLPANLTHAKVARENKPQQPKSAGTKPPQSPRQIRSLPSSAEHLAITEH
jgi:hypothetical protein